jgi:hypothetical protein
MVKDLLILCNLTFNRIVEVVDCIDLMTGFQHLQYRVRPNESSSSGDQDSHFDAAV